MRYFFAQDESCHWYMIPEKHRKLWHELHDIEDGWEDERWCFDEYRVDGGITRYSFTDVKDDTDL